MNRTKTTLTILAASFLGAMPLLAQQHRLSPHETTGTVVDGDRVTVIYGRPYTKDPVDGKMRKIWGDLVPFDKVWRTGADESTLFITQKPIKVGDTTIPAGAYSLYTLPEENGASKLIINKEIGQWGTNYDEKQDLARIDLTKGATEKPVDQFTIKIEKNPSGGGVLKMEWENTEYSLPFTVEK
jgi:hypothetical protein